MKEAGRTLAASQSPPHSGPTEDRLGLERKRPFLIPPPYFWPSWLTITDAGE